MMVRRIGSIVRVNDEEPDLPVTIISSSTAGKRREREEQEEE